MFIEIKVVRNFFNMRFGFKLCLSLIHIILALIPLGHNIKLSKTDLEVPLSYNNVTGELQTMPQADASFWNDLSRKRPKSGIDVTKHSKEARLFNIFSSASEEPLYDPTEDPPTWNEPENPKTNKQPVEIEVKKSLGLPIGGYDTSEDGTRSNNGGQKKAVEAGKKPGLKIGIILPRQIFQQRRYQAIISKSLMEISQEKCDHVTPEFSIFESDENQDVSEKGNAEDEKKKNDTAAKWNQKSSIFSKGSRKGGLATLFRSTTEPSRKKVDTSKHQRPGSLLEHVRQSYDFAWNGGMFRLDDENDSVNFGDLVVSPPPSDITDVLCQQLSNGSAAILYFTNTEKFGRSTAASQYFLQMAGFLGIPVIAWNADNTGLESRATYHLGSEMTGHLQLAPSVDHQVSAMLSILDRYNWRQFGILTSEVAGHGDFVQAVRDQVQAAAKHGRSRYTVQSVFKASDSSNWDVSALANSEVRIIILYCTQSEAALILEQAAKSGLTSHKYLWLVTQSVIGDPEDRSTMRRSLPIGMIGIHFDVDMERVLQNFVSLGLKVFFHAVDSMLERNSDFNSNGESNQSTNPLVGDEKRLFDYDLNCQGVNSNHRWENGPQFYRELLNITLTMKREKSERRKIFDSEGYIRDTQLKIMNLKPVSNQAAASSGGGLQYSAHAKWEEVGTWNTWNGLDIKDIVWPGNSHVPPQGVPEQFHMKITFLEEPPFIIISDPDPVTSKCSMNRGVPCWMNDIRPTLSEKKKLNGSQSEEVLEGYKCCSGFCIDLLTKFEDELGFTFDLVRVPDPKWGTFENGKWNGLMNELVGKKTDMVLSALKINAERESVVDFTVPFLESGIAIIVAKRTGIISPTAFLEPFDTLSWMLIALVAIQASAFSIFLFEWLSPSGYDMQLVPPAKSGHRFSLFRTYWLVWAVLFQAAVQVDCPRGLTARFMSGIWALFAVVFLALYTANLAAFMIPRKEFHNLEGLDDPKIKNPHSHKPSLKFGTIPSSYSEVTLKKYFPDVFTYMKPFNRYNTTERAMRAVKEGEFDAFIYDGTVLNYLASQDEECRLLQVGSWSAMTGYALAFPVHSKYKAMFNEKLLELRENGDLERLGRFWMSGTCKPNEQEKRASEPLSIAQFLSAFLLLGIGTLISVVLFLLEHAYMRYLRSHVVDKNSGSSKAGACCALVSQSIGQNYIRRQEAAKELSSCKELVNRKSGYSDDYSDVYGHDVYGKDANVTGNILDDNEESSRCEKSEKDSREKKDKKKKKKRKSSHRSSLESTSLSPVPGILRGRNSLGSLAIRSNILENRNSIFGTENFMEGRSNILGTRNRLSCQDESLCDGQLDQLHSELDVAKKQIRFLENLLCKYDKEIDDFTSNAAFDNVSDHQAHAQDHDRAQDLDRDDEDDDVDGKEDKLGAEGAETDAEVNRLEEEGLMWLDDLPPLPLSPPDLRIMTTIYSDFNGSCTGINEDLGTGLEVVGYDQGSNRDVISITDDVIDMRDVILDNRYHSMISIEANGDVIVIKQPMFRGKEIEEKETVL